MAQTLRDAGAAVLGVGRGAASTLPPGIEWVQADLTTDAGVSAVAAAAVRWRANVVVHAAGVPAFGPLAAVGPAQMQAVLQANLLAPMQLTQALLPHLRGLPRAQVVFVGSALGRIGLPGFSVYGASKAGLHGFAEALRRELADTSVRVQILGAAQHAHRLQRRRGRGLQPGHRHRHGSAAGRGRGADAADRERSRRAIPRLPRTPGRAPEWPARPCARRQLRQAPPQHCCRGPAPRQSKENRHEETDRKPAVPGRRRRDRLAAGCARRPGGRRRHRTAARLGSDPLPDPGGRAREALRGAGGQGAPGQREIPRAAASRWCGKASSSVRGRARRAAWAP